MSVKGRPEHEYRSAKREATRSSDKARAPRWWLWLALSVVVVIADQVTKTAVLAALQPGEQRVVTGFFSIVLAFNSGAAFSFLGDAAGWQRYLFSAVAIGASALLVWMLS